MSLQINLSYACQWLSRRMTRSIAQRMAADGSGLLILVLVNSLHDGFRAIFLSGWRRIAHSFSCKRLSRRFARCIAQRMTVDCSFLHLSTAFTTVFAPYFSADGSGRHIHSLVNGFHDGLRAVICGCQRIAHTSARHRLSQRIPRRIA